MSAKLFDGTLIREPQDAINFLANVLEASTEYSIIGNDINGTILLWNEGARRLYGYEPEEVISKANSSILHTAADVQAGKNRAMLDAALREGKWEGTIERVRKNGDHFTARVVVTPRRDASGRAIGFLLISKDISDEIRLTDELQATQFYTRSLIESNIDALMTTNPLGVITDINKQMEALTGYGRDELIGSPFKNYFTDPQRAEEGIKLVLREGSVRNYELTALSKEGRHTVVSYNASTFCDAAGRLQGVFAAARDITEQAQLQTQLAEERAYNRGLIEASLDGLITVDPLLNITDVNETMCTMSGYSRIRLIGSAFPDYFVDSRRAAEGVRLTLDKGAVTNYELTLKKSDGRAILVSFNAAIFKDQSGVVRGIFASARDITEQSQLQTQLAEERAYNRGLIEASVDGLVTVDESMTITDVNETMCRMAGRPRNQLVGSSFPSYFTDPQRAAEGVRLTFQQGAVTNYVLNLQGADGHHVPVSFNAAVFRGPTGEVRGIFASARDITDQKQLGQQLRDSHFYTRSLIESNIDALMTTDPLGIITDVNQQMEALTGRTREELIGTPFKQYFTDPGRAEEGIRRVLRESRVTNYELTARSKTGRETVVSCNAVTFNDASGKLQGVFAAARDITEQKRLERQLRERQNYLRGLIESSVDGLITVDPSGTITDVNETMCRMAGYTRAELIGTPFADYFTDPDRARGGVQQTFEAGVVTEYALTLVARSRRLFQVSFNASVFKDAAGNVRGIFASARDVTDRTRLEDQMRENQAYNRGLIESSVDGLVTVDPEGIITDVNQQMESLTGCTRDELIGTPFKQYFTDSERAEEGIRKVLREGRVTNYELTARSKIGPETVVSYNATTFYDQSGKLRGVFAAARDVTERKRFEQTLQEKNVDLENASLAKDRFLANMSHELRTPLNAIIGFTGTLLMKLPGPLTLDQDKQLTIIQNSARYLLSLINDLLDLAKIESGKVELNLEPVVCRSLVEEVAASLRILAEARGLEFEVKIPKPETSIRSDRRALSQILINLSNNAIKFTEKGKVIIEVEQASLDGRSRTELRVIDTGMGIPAEEQSKMFQAFERVSTAGATRQEGTGLGLHLSQKLAALLGGHIEFQSVRGKGSTFTLVLEQEERWERAFSSSKTTPTTWN